MNTLKQNKAIIRDFMRAHYTDAKLVELLDHARSGKLSYWSCCCFIGLPTANHELTGEGEYCDGGHYIAAQSFDYAAEVAFMRLGDDYGRRRILIPMVLAEIRRRAKARVSPEAEAVRG